MPIESHRYETFDVDAQTHSTPAAGADVAAGNAVKLTGEMQVEVTDTADEDIYGLAVTDATAGEDVGVYYQGCHPATVTNPDGAVTAGDYLTPSGSATGILRPINSGAATGESRQEDGLFRAKTDEDADGTALVHIR